MTTAILRHPARRLALLGGTLLMVAILWWASIFQQVIGNGYLSLPEVVICAAVSSGVCDLATSLCGKTHPLGLAWYSPLLLWASVAFLSVAALVQSSYEYRE